MMMIISEGSFEMTVLADYDAGIKLDSFEQVKIMLHHSHMLTNNYITTIEL